MAGIVPAADGADGELFAFNGIDATTGSYLIPPLPPEQVSALARGQQIDPTHLNELRWWHERVTGATFGPREGVDPKKLESSGWGVIFSHDADPAIREALGDLLGQRQAEAAAEKEHRYREFSGPLAYRPGESKQQFLARHGAGPGPADPDVVPYYLLIVGSPESIPYSFQYQLDVQYAVGRIHFETVEEYANYARNVLRAETTAATGTPRAAFFGTRNAEDRATALSARELVVPLAQHLAKDRPDWSVETFVAEEATKQALSQLLAPDAPQLLFTASHGVGFPNGHPRQLRHQGALLCQEWPGPMGPGGDLCEDHYFCADDVGDQGLPPGLVAFHFACFGAGTPEWDEYVRQRSAARPQLAPRPFVAALPQRLLSHPRGGAVAVVGHVERAWGYSFSWPGAGRQTAVYEDSLKRLADGHPIGSAFESMNERYAELSSDLSAMLEDVEFGKVPDHRALAAMWTSNNDARGFVILGDPAVKLGCGNRNASTTRAAAAGTAPAVATTAPAGAVGPGEPRLLAGERPAAGAWQPAAPLSRPEPGAGGAGVTAPDPEAVDFGLLDGVKRAREGLGNALQRLAEAVGAALERGIENVNVLEVQTYVSEDVGAVSYDRSTGRFDGSARLRALTRITLAGDTIALVPEGAAGGDEALWNIHLQMVEQARRARNEFLGTTASAAAGLLDVLKVL